MRILLRKLKRKTKKMFQTYYKSSNISLKLVSVLSVDKSQKEKPEFKQIYQISLKQRYTYYYKYYRKPFTFTFLVSNLAK
jgi:hypothetical protein